MQYEELREAFGEMEAGFTPQEAVTEASRCIKCQDAPCIRGCPAEVEVSKFIRQIATRNFRGAIRVIKEANILAGICARICPQAVLCEGECSSSELAEPIRIGRLQRFAAEHETTQGSRPLRSLPPKEMRVAVVGSGPAGLSAATFLKRLGYEVDVFEAEAHAGGLLTFAIPAYRLPKEIVDQEIGYVKSLGVQLHLNRGVADPAALRGDYRAVFLGAGGGRPLALGVEGETLPGVLQGLDLLREVNVALLEKRDCAVTVTDPVVVIGGGNAAMDAAVTARKLGAMDVTVVYRRSEGEMPAWEEERAFALRQGVKIQTLRSPLRFIEKEGRLEGIQCQAMRLAEPDASGRRRPVPVEAETYVLPCRTALVAVGQGAPVEPGNFSRTETGHLAADPETLATSVPGIYAGGDLVRGSSTAVQAVADGKRAAFAMDAWIQQSSGR